MIKKTATWQRSEGYPAQKNSSTPGNLQNGSAAAVCVAAGIEGGREADDVEPWSHRKSIAGHAGGQVPCDRYLAAVLCYTVSGLDRTLERGGRK